MTLNSGPNKETTHFACLATREVLAVCTSHIRMTHAGGWSRKGRERALEKAKKGSKRDANRDRPVVPELSLEGMDGYLTRMGSSVLKSAIWNAAPSNSFLRRFLGACPTTREKRPCLPGGGRVPNCRHAGISGVSSGYSVTRW